MDEKPLRVLDPEGEAQFFETVLKCVADGVFTVDKNWKITSFNRAAERITGVPVQEAIGKRCSEVFHSDLCEHACPIRETLETGTEVIDRPAQILSRQGKPIPISVSSAVLRAAAAVVFAPRLNIFHQLLESTSMGEKGTMFCPECGIPLSSKAPRRRN